LESDNIVFFLIFLYVNNIFFIFKKIIFISTNIKKKIKLFFSQNLQPGKRLVEVPLNIKGRMQGHETASIQNLKVLTHVIRTIFLRV